MQGVPNDFNGSGVRAAMLELETPVVNATFWRCRHMQADTAGRHLNAPYWSVSNAELPNL